MISSINKIILNNNIKLNNSLYKSISKTLLVNSYNNINNSNNNNSSNNNNNNQLYKYYSSKNFKNFSSFKEQRKYYEQQYKKQQQQEKREREYYNKQSKEQEYQYSEQQQQQQQQLSRSIILSILKLVFKIAGTIFFGWLKKKLVPTEYKELFNFTKETIYKQKNLIKNTLAQQQLQQNILINIEPKVISTSFIPKHSAFMNQEDQVMMVCELPTQSRYSSLHVVTLARSLPDLVVPETSIWSFFGIGNSTKTVKSAEPIRITLLIDNDTVDPFGFISNEKREILLYSNENYSSDDGFGGYEYDVFERKQQGNNEEEEDTNDQYYQEKHQYNRNSNSNSNSNSNNKKNSNTGDTIVLDPKDFHEVTNKKNR